MTTIHDTVRAIEWRDDALWLLDQRVLPHQCNYLRFDNAPSVAQAITDMVVRGAPAIGVTAAYGVALAVRRAYQSAPATWQNAIAADIARLAAARPTAVNLCWALTHMQQALQDINGDPYLVALAAAKHLHENDIAANRRMGALGAELITERGALLTHCNTGSLATAGYGTALGVIRAAYAQGKVSQVYADETRPWLQGARLTAWELVADHIPVTLLVEGAASALLQRGEVRWVIVGADRIAANGDTANKIGTFHLAVAARYHGVKFMVVAPTSTFDLTLADGSHIPIETRAAQEILEYHGHPIAPAGAQAWNPAFDVTPAALIDAIVTERGVIAPPTPQNVARVINSA